MNHTTDLHIIRQHPRRFTWGTVTQIHDIGNGAEGPLYTVVEHYDDRPTVMAVEGYVPERRFHVYVEGRDTCQSTLSLEEALVLAIAIHKLGKTSGAEHMARAATQLLGCRTTK